MATNAALIYILVFCRRHRDFNSSAKWLRKPTHHPWGCQEDKELYVFQISTAEKVCGHLCVPVTAQME